MRLFRKNLRFGTRLALLALAIQFVVSFAHVHPVTHAVGFTDAIAVIDGTPANPLAPADTNDPVCSVCVLLQLTAASVTSAAPVLELPQQFVWTPPQPFLAAPATQPTIASFNARAPPSSSHHKPTVLLLSLCQDRVACSSSQIAPSMRA